MEEESRSKIRRKCVAVVTGGSCGRRKEERFFGRWFVECSWAWGEWRKMMKKWKRKCFVRILPFLLFVSNFFLLSVTTPLSFYFHPFALVFPRLSSYFSFPSTFFFFLFQKENIIPYFETNKIGLFWFSDSDRKEDSFDAKFGLGVKSKVEDG